MAMSPRLALAFRSAARLTPHEQDELAERILHEVAPELVVADRAPSELETRYEWRPLLPRLGFTTRAD